MKNHPTLSSEIVRLPLCVLLRLEASILRGVPGIVATTSVIEIGVARLKATAAISVAREGVRFSSSLPLEHWRRD